MVLGTVSATNAASQQLRLDYITTKPLSSFSAFKDALPEQQRDLEGLKARVAFVGAGTPYALVFAVVAYHYHGHDMTSCCWLVVMGSKRFASPIMGIFCGGLNAYCMRIWPLFLRTSGSSGVLKALFFFFFFFGRERYSLHKCNDSNLKSM